MLVIITEKSTQQHKPPNKITTKQSTNKQHYKDKDNLVHHQPYTWSSVGFQEWLMMYQSVFVIVIVV